MTRKSRRILGRVMTIIIILVLVGYRFGGDIYKKVVHDSICEKTVVEAGILSTVRSIEYSILNEDSPKAYTLVLGYDNYGDERAVWLDFENDRFKPNIYYRTSLEHGLSRSNALGIITDSSLLNHITDISVAYIKNSTSSLEKGLYWIISDGNGKLVYVNKQNGEYSLHEQTEDLASRT